MQSPALGKMQHVVASLILSNQALDLLRFEPSLHLPMLLSLGPM